MWIIVSFAIHLKWSNINIKTLCLLLDGVFLNNCATKGKENSDHSSALIIFSALPPFFLMSFSPPSMWSLPLPPPFSPHSPCWIGGVNTGRERALFHRTRAGAGAGRSCRAPVLGSKVYCGFHFTFPQPITEPHWCVWTLTSAKNSTQKMVWRQFRNCTRSHLPFFPLLLLFLSFNWTVSCVDGV